MITFNVGEEAIEEKGWLGAHRMLLLRRLSQLSIMALFMVGPLFGVWIITGNLSSSLILGTVPLSDPFVIAQMFAAGHWPEISTIVGVSIVIALYVLVGGRSYCSWVCPVNVVTDTASWIRRALGLKGGLKASGDLRYWVLAMTLIMSAAFGMIIWEFVNPVSMMHRGLIFGMGAAWSIIAGIFFYDLFVANAGWCGHFCPMGAFYSLIGKVSILRISAPKREACNNCMDCFAVCPEPQVIPPALRGAKSGASPVIESSECTNCGRCIDVCSLDVFNYTSRFNNALPAGEVKSTQSISTFNKR